MTTNDVLTAMQTAVVDAMKYATERVESMHVVCKTDSTWLVRRDEAIRLRFNAMEIIMRDCGLQL